MKANSQIFSRFNLYVLVMLGIVSLIIIWYTHARIDEHRSYHTQSGYSATQKTAHEISTYIAEKKRLLDFFASQHASTLLSLLQQPADNSNYQALQRKLKTVFPDFITFTVINDTGTLSYSDPDHIKTPDCITDIQHFINHKPVPLRIHPASPHHFSIFSRFSKQQESGIVIASFNTDTVSHTLLQSEISGHQLFITLPSENNLIELSATGNRNSWLRDNYHLSPEESKRIIARSPISNSDWEVVDLLSEKLFSDYSQKIIQQSYIMISILVLASIIVISLNRKEVERRQKAEIVKDEFLSIVSHELRTPLTAIGGSLQLITAAAKDCLNSQNISLLEMALNNTARLTTLVNDLLDVQKIESGHMGYTRKLIQPVTFVESATQSILKSRTDCHCKIDIKNDLNKELVFVDRERMEQVIINLLSNAIKYGRNAAPEKNDCINIHLYMEKKSVVISVTDYGEGIAEKNKNVIFEKFRQSNMTDQRSKSGSGLGLYISKSIVDYHGGIITYISTPGTGTTFYIKLPVISISQKQKLQGN